MPSRGYTSNWAETAGLEYLSGRNTLPNNLRPIDEISREQVSRLPGEIRTWQRRRADETRRMWNYGRFWTNVIRTHPLPDPVSTSM
jgi:hypothetical protein